MPPPSLSCEVVVEVRSAKIGRVGDAAGLRRVRVDLGHEKLKLPGEREMLWIRHALRQRARRELIGVLAASVDVVVPVM